MKNRTYKNFVIHEFVELESTNSHALELAALRKLSDHEIICAASQTAGRGRMDRSWISPQGNLYFSLVLQPKVALEKIPQLSFVAIVALRKAVEKITKKSVKNKWPNDLLIEGKKVAGLLLESKISGKDAQFVILGIGINIESNPDNTIFPAGNLQEFAIEITPQNLLEKFLDEFEMLYQNWLAYGFTAARQSWLQGAYKLKEKITVNAIEGIFEDVDLEGNLLLKNDDGILKISVADVS